jgi:hypothetical protein
MWKFLKRRRVIKVCVSSAGDADNSDEIRDENSQTSDKYYYTNAKTDRSKVRFYNESYLSLGFAWTDDSSCPFRCESVCVANGLRMQQ